MPRNELEELRLHINSRIQEKIIARKRRERSKKSYTPPRYDDVFFEGVDWLNKLGGGGATHE